MTDQEIRLDILKMVTPRDIANPDVAMILDRARAYEAYVMGAGQAAKPPQQAPQPPQQVRTTSQSQSPAQRK